MENSSSYTRPDIINLVLIVLLGVMLAIHVGVSQGNHTLVAKQEVQHVSTISSEIRALQAEVKELKSKSGITGN